MLARTFGQRLKTLREERGLTQRQLAERIKTQLAQISRYEHGHYLPNAETLAQIASVLQADLDALLLGKTEPQGDQQPPVKNIALLERLTDIDGLPREDQEMLVKLIEAVVKSRKGEKVFASSRRSA